jgi:cysteine synthase A
LLSLWLSFFFFFFSLLLELHYQIWAQLAGKVDAFSCATGTGGTISGVAAYLRKQNPNVKICLTDPCGAVLYRYYTEGQLKAVGDSISEGIGQGRITGNMKDFTPDMAFEVCKY